MKVHFEKTDTEGVFSFTLSYGDVAAAGRVFYGPEDEHGTMPCRVEYTGGKPNLIDSAPGRSTPIDADVHVMAALQEFVNA